jgi:hypothetical protein
MLPPPDPGPIPMHAANATTAICETDRLNHKAAQKLFNNHNNMKDALKTQIIDVATDTYLDELRNRYTGYLGITPRALIDHLLTQYGKITASDITNCCTKMEAPMDATRPIDIYFQIIDDCVQFATDGQVPFTPTQIVQTAYHAVCTSAKAESTMTPVRNGDANPLPNEHGPHSKRSLPINTVSLKNNTN